MKKRVLEVTMGGGRKKIILGALRGGDILYDKSNKRTGRVARVGEKAVVMRLGDGTTWTASLENLQLTDSQRKKVERGE